MVNLVKDAILVCIRGYQASRPLRLPRCRFYPSCSTYAAAAIQKHGLASAILLTGMRILKCHPFHPGGIDDVPERLSFGQPVETVKRLIISQLTKRINCEL